MAGIIAYASRCPRRLVGYLHKYSHPLCIDPTPGNAHPPIFLLEGIAGLRPTRRAERQEWKPFVARSEHGLLCGAQEGSLNCGASMPGPRRTKAQQKHDDDELQREARGVANLVRPNCARVALPHTQLDKRAKSGGAFSRREFAPRRRSI